MNLIVSANKGDMLPRTYLANISIFKLPLYYHCNLTDNITYKYQTYTYNTMKNGINIEDCRRFWESSGGEVKGGHFNESLYLRFLEHYNNR